MKKKAFGRTERDGKPIQIFSGCSGKYTVNFTRWGIPGKYCTGNPNRVSPSYSNPNQLPLTLP